MARLHVVLVGLPGCGKTVAGRLVAQKLDARFVDIDQTIVDEQAKSIAEIFAATGEVGFRALEGTAMARALNSAAAVISPGGGWAAQPGNLELAEPQSLLVYMRVTPGSAAERLRDGTVRPLLTGTDPVAQLSQLLAEREPYYRRAGHSIDTDGRTPEMVADMIVMLARRHGGWGADD